MACAQAHPRRFAGRPAARPGTRAFHRAIKKPAVRCNKPASMWHRYMLFKNLRRHASPLSSLGHFRLSVVPGSGQTSAVPAQDTACDWPPALCWVVSLGQHLAAARCAERLCALRIGPAAQTCGSACCAAGETCLTASDGTKVCCALLQAPSAVLDPSSSSFQSLCCPAMRSLRLGRITPSAAADEWSLREGSGHARDFDFN